ncbi:hypothetical protein IC757_01700 [Wenzhouxiangella sp. AB-CW3]|uniref:hypothetical protein n=1 Tax=Wenzhouxiangella sp. AB-CW3 TaxID=2771012 RepID=UPI00168B700A|nr:hypothetical protein [Wenzhouxiangella sp. AB-CW3]QOC22901.1 hypothetical protein IC757_01700 [Wenzhouxiangella sp. AB-CW3]
MSRHRNAQCRRFAIGLALLALTSAHWGAVSAGDSTIHSGHSALWHQPDHDGEGWVLEMVEPDRAVLYWFTYDDNGDQRWLIGDGFVETVDHGQQLRFPELRTTSGGRFGPGFDPDEVSDPVVGDAVMQFEDCEVGSIRYRAFGHEEELTIARLTQTMGSACDESDLPIRSEAGLSGSWFDPDHAGEGFILHWLDRDEALMLWFTYAPDGDQAWMMGTGLATNGAVVFDDVHQPMGGRFGQERDSSEVSRPEWGELVFELECNSGLVSYQSDLPGYGAGEQQLVRLSQLEDIECPFPVTAHARLDQAQWDDQFGVAGIGGKTIFNPAVLDFEALDDDRLLAVGDFAWHGNQRREGAMVLESDGWQAPEGLPDLEITESITAAASHPEHGLALAVQESLLMEGEAHGGRVILQNADGAVHTIFLYDGLIRELVWFEDQLWLGGYFAPSDEVPMPAAATSNSHITNLAVWNGQDTEPAPDGSPDGPVYAIKRDLDQLIIGGDFSAIGDQPANRSAMWDGQEWVSMDLPGSGRILSVTSDNGTLYASGYRLSDAEDAVARHTGEGWESIGSGFYLGDVAGVVSDVRKFNGSLYAIGCFDHLNAPASDGGTSAPNGIARWNGGRWEDPQPAPDFVGTVYWTSLACGGEPSPLVAWVLRMQQLVKHQGQLYAGGAFGGLSGVASHGLIAFDGEKFRAQGEAGLGTSGPVTSLATRADGAGVYAYGPTHFGGQQARSGVARLVDNTWEPVEHRLPEPEDGYWLECGAPGQGLVMDGQDTLYLGCTMQAESQPDGWSARLFRLGPDGWEEVPGTESLPGISAITADSAGTIWIAGGEQVDLDSGTGYIARVIDGQVEVFEDHFDGMVSRLDVAAGAGASSLVAAGSFQSVDGLTARHVAYFNGDQWQALGSGVSDVPNVLHYDGNRIHVSVASSGQGDDPDRLVLGYWDGEEWIELATEERGFPAVAADTAAQFFHIIGAGDRLFLAGNVHPADDQGSHLFVYEDGRFEPLAGGLTALIDAMALTPDALLLGGQIYQVDPDGEAASSIGMARLLWH